MRKLAFIAVLVAGVAAPGVWGSWRKDSSDLMLVNRVISGRVVDFTANHGCDNRIHSRALGQKRDVYVYVPPGYTPKMRYPFVLFLHGFAQDEKVFLKFVPYIDEAICKGKLPPMIIAVPDGSIPGEPSLIHPATFFLDTDAGDFEKFVLEDTWDFVCSRFPIRSERQAHVLAGVSMGGFAAYNFALRHKEAFGVAVGVFPPLNLRWVDKNQYYFANFDPRNWGWRASVDTGKECIAQFGPVKLRLPAFVRPLFGEGAEALAAIARNNPIELLNCCNIQNGEIAMYVGYGGHDEFNIDAQVESFLYLAKYRGLSVGVGYIPEGRHDMNTAYRLFPSIVEWLNPRLRPYGPIPNQEPCPQCTPAL